MWQDKVVEGYVDPPLVAIDLVKLEQAKSFLRSVNSIPLKNIVWMRDGVEVVPKKSWHRKIWKFFGFLNEDFPAFCYL